MTASTSSFFAQLLAAVDFAARKHRAQRRKDSDATPYINHPIAVAELLARVASVEELPALQAALLHDTLEDTKTTPEELGALFGEDVRRLVQELTDDKSLPQAERKRLQVEHAPDLSPRARLIKLADKIANLGDLTPTAPVAWPIERKREYLAWAASVVAAIRGSNPALERLFDQTLAEKQRLFGT